MKNLLAGQLPESVVPLGTYRIDNDGGTAILIEDKGQDLVGDQIEATLGGLLRDNALDEMWSLFYVANAFLFPMYATFEAKHELSRPEFVTLFHLHHLSGLIAQEISELSGLPKNSISRGVKRLSARGLIKGVKDSSDRRRIVLSMTDHGEALFRILLAEACERRRRMVAPLSEGERVMLREILLKLAHEARARIDGPA